MTQFYGHPGLSGAYGQPGLSRSLGGAAAPPSTLLDNIFAWWKYDEESGDRADSVDSYDLSDANTVGFDTGKIGNAAKFIAANNERLTRANDSKFYFLSGADRLRTISFWWKPTSNVNSFQIPADFFVSGPGVWSFYRTVATNTMNFSVVDTASSIKNVVSSVSVTMGSWYHITGGYDDSSGKSFIVVNETRNDFATAFTLGAASSSSPTLVFGTRGTSTTLDFDGLLDLGGMWANQSLTNDEISELNNDGDGLDYPFTG